MIGCAELVPEMRLAERRGLPELVADRLRVADRLGVEGCLDRLNSYVRREQWWGTLLLECRVVTLVNVLRTGREREQNGAFISRERPHALDRPTGGEA